MDCKEFFFRDGAISSLLKYTRLAGFSSKVIKLSSLLKKIIYLSAVLPLNV